MSEWSDWSRTVLDGWGPPLGILVGVSLLGWIARGIVFRYLRRLADRTRTRIDELLLDSTRRYWFPAAFLLALLVASRIAPLDERAKELVGNGSRFLLVVTVTLAAARFASAWFAHAESGPDSAPAVPSLVAKAARILVLLVGFMTALEAMNLQITPLLTALGVGSLAVGLALQPTLSNFFAGIHLSMSKPIRIGDFVELEDGTQGHVVDISWRTTKLRQPANNLVIVPNARISDMRLLNYSMPENPQAVVIAMGVAYGSDLRRVEAVCFEVAKAVLAAHPVEADPSFEPVVRFHTFADSSINFNVILRARAMTDRFALVHDFIQRIHERFGVEGIEIPFPQRVIHRADAAAAAPSKESDS